VLVYDTLYGNPEDVLFALDHLKQPSSEKIVILVSHLGVWGQNGLKEKVVETKESKDDLINADGDNADGVEEHQADDKGGREPSLPKDQPSKPQLGGFDDDDDDDLKPKEPSKVEEPKPVEPQPTPEPSEPLPPVYVPWMETDFKERMPSEE
jgi:hypothetical protein